MKDLQRRNEVNYLEREIFLDLAGRYKDTIFRVALNMLGSPADADDIVQETLIKLLKRQEPFESEDHAKNWLIRVAVNLSKNVLRAPWRRHDSLEIAENMMVFDTPEQGELYEEVMALPEKYRTVLYLYYYEGYSVKEIAEILNIQTTAVTSWLSRARQKLKFQITELREGCVYG